ncbi:MAG: alpha/beta hydrolase [Muribaculaceae bacterium]|nr:alpha/beta hydrolase [Muribaculaceae bacterium]
MGNCHIFDFLQPLLPENYEVRYLSLAGHGGNAADFSQASMALWRDQVDEAVNDMNACYRRVVIVAHSMGCLLAINTAIRTHVDALLLLNPPMRIRPSWRMIKNAAKVMFGMTNGDPVAIAAREAYGIEIDYNPLHYYGWPMRYIELFMESARIRQLIQRTYFCRSATNWYLLILQNCYTAILIFV